MKNRKNLGCLIKGKKERGAWAELYFMVLAMSQGLRVSSPYGGFGPYDVGVEGGTGPILRVQVKCTVFRCGQGYSINCFGPKQGPKRCGYAPGTVDFFALYIVPTDDWYIMPYAVMGREQSDSAFHARQRAAKIRKVSGSVAFAVECNQEPRQEGIGDTCVRR
jgi:PD-(D/E)XK endonuclease